MTVAGISNKKTIFMYIHNEYRHHIFPVLILFKHECNVFQFNYIINLGISFLSFLLLSLPLLFDNEQLFIVTELTFTVMLR